METSDETLAAQFRQTGDRRAFETIVRRHLLTLRRFLSVSLAGDAEAAADAEQEVLLRLHRSLGQWRGEGAFTTFLFILARRAAADEVRKRVRWRRREDRFARQALPENELRQSEADPQSGWLRREEGLRLRRALAEIDEPDRTMLYLKDAEDVEVAELSRIYQMKEGTLKSRLSRARARLRDLLKEERFA